MGSDELAVVAGWMQICARQLTIVQRPPVDDEEDMKRRASDGVIDVVTAFVDQSIESTGTVIHMTDPRVVRRFRHGTCLRSLGRTLGARHKPRQDYSVPWQ